VRRTRIAHGHTLERTTKTRRNGRAFAQQL
jgi:hypothetical protein